MILDSDVLIDILRGHPTAINWLAQQSSTLTVSGITALEIVYGSADAAGLRAARNLIEVFFVEWPTSGDIKAAFDLASLHLSAGIEGPDAITASIALRSGVPVATFNSKHYRSVPGLVVTAPYIR